MIKKKQLNKYEINIYCDNCEAEMYLYKKVDSDRIEFTMPFLLARTDINYYEQDYVYRCPMCQSEKISEERYPKTIWE